MESTENFYSSLSGKMEESDFNDELPCKADFTLLLVMKLFIWHISKIIIFGAREHENKCSKSIILTDETIKPRAF